MNASRDARLLRPLLHADTYDLFVVPALADLDYAPCLAAHMTVWRSLVGAASCDLRSDVQSLTRDVRLIAALTLMQGCYYGAMLLLLVADVRMDEAVARLTHGGAVVLAGLVAAVLLASALPTLCCFWPPRRARSA